jgi:hypothetical protein
MPNINSNSNRVSTFSGLKSILLPSGLEVFLYLVVSILLLSLSNAKKIWHYFSGYFSHQSGFDLGSKIPGINTLSKAYQGRVLQIIFWVIVGIAIYTLFWFLRNIVNNVRNDVVAGSYVRPRDYKVSNYWKSILMRKILFGLSVVLLIVYLYAGIQMVAQLGSLCYDYVTKFQPIHSTLYILGGLFFTCLLLHVFIILCRVSARSWQFIYTDL